MKQMKKPFISIIIAVYNNEKYLPFAVNSVLKQDVKDIEIIIIDDGSTDNTPIIADELAKSDNRIKVIHQENQWIFASFNNGIEIANGEYIYILNSDDTLVDGCLKILENMAMEYKPDVIFTKVTVNECDENQNIIKYDCGNRNGLVTEDKYLLKKQDIIDNFGWLIETLLFDDQANLYAANILKKYKFRNDVYGADTLYNIQIADELNSAIVYSGEVYQHYIYNLDNMNTAVGKYYGYEHSMYNEIYNGYIKLINKWNIKNMTLLKKMYRTRLSLYTSEMLAMQYKNCKLTIDEKICKVIDEDVDEFIVECARKSNCEEELESRILSFLRELFIKEVPKKTDEYYFMYELLESLLRYEKDEVDIKRIYDGVYNEKNPKRIGKIFFDKIIDK